MIHHIDVMLHRRAESCFDLWVFRSFAEALAEWLLDAGAEDEIAFAGQADQMAAG
jgi:heterotetrameric sarcosine oxidase gamma subunit